MIYPRRLIPTTTQLALPQNIENLDDDFELKMQNTSPRKPELSTPRRRHVREESWDDELELGTKPDDFRFAPANPSPLPPMPLFPSNNQHLSPEPFPHSPTASVFSVPNTIHTYSSLVPIRVRCSPWLYYPLRCLYIKNERGGG